MLLLGYQIARILMNNCMIRKGTAAVHIVGEKKCVCRDFTFMYMFSHLGRSVIKSAVHGVAGLFLWYRVLWRL